DASACAIFQYPCIDLFLKESVRQDADQGPIAPSNTDLSSQFAKTTPDDYRFDLDDPKLWSTGVPPQVPREPIGTWPASPADSVLRYAGPLWVRLGDSSHLYLRVVCSDDVLPRAVSVTFLFEGEPLAADNERTATIPMLIDSARHGYTLDLRMLNMPSSARVTGITLPPLAEGMRSGNPVMQLSDLSVIRRPGMNWTAP